MASTITLRKTKFDGLGSVLDKLCSCFGNYDSTMKELKRSASGVDSTTCDLEAVIDDISNSQESKEEKVKRAKELNRKLDTFVRSAVQHESDSADQIKKEKQKFYRKYSYLEPDCEKGFFKKVGEFLSSAAEKISEWVSDNLIALIVAAVIVLAAIIIVVFCPAAVCAIAAIIVGVLSAAMGIGDIVCTLCTGMSVAELLDSKGFHVLSQIYKGLGWGLDIASIILPIGALSSAGKTALKETLKHPFKALAGAFKEGAKGIKVALTGLKKAFGKGFGEGMKTLGKGIGKFTLKTVGDMLGVDDLKNGWQLGKAIVQGKRGDELGNAALKILGVGGISLPDKKEDGSRMFNNDKYNTLVNANKTELNATGELSSDLSEMSWKYEPAKGSDQANAIAGLRNGTLPSGDSVDSTMRTSFYDAVKGDADLTSKIESATGINMSNITNEQGFNRALERNGFELHTSFGDNKTAASVSVMPTWATKSTNTHNTTFSNGLNLMQAGAQGFSTKDVVRNYNHFIDFKQTSFGEDLGKKMIGKGFDATFGKAADFTYNYFDMPKEIESGFENTFNIKLDDHPIIKTAVVDRISGTPMWLKDLSIADNFYGDTIKATPKLIYDVAIDPIINK